MLITWKLSDVDRAAVDFYTSLFYTFFRIALKLPFHFVTNFSLIKYNFCVYKMHFNRRKILNFGRVKMMLSLKCIRNFKWTKHSNFKTCLNNSKSVLILLISSMQFAVTNCVQDT